jgi:uncharacterized membrane protein YbhN (UPF0104 family)
MKPSGRRNRILRILPGIFISAVAILVLIWQVNWRQTLQAWNRAQLWVMVPAVLLIVCAMLTRAVAWRYLMKNSVPLGKSFWILNISYMLNGLLPFRLGDVARAYLISRPGGTGGGITGEKERDAASEPPPIGAGTALSAVALERVFDLIYTALFILLAFPMLSGKVVDEWLLLFSSGLAAAGFLGLLVLGALRARIMHAAERAAQKVPIIRLGVKPLAQFLEGLRQMRDLRYSLPAFFFIGLTMILWAADYWVVLRGFFPDAAVYWGLLALVGGLIGVGMPSSPAALGVFEVTLTLVLTAAGMNREVAVAYALALHMLNTITNTLLGLLGLLTQRQSLGSILSAAHSAENP